MNNCKKISEIPFLKIIKRSWNITWKNKFLWIFGAFISLTNFNSSWNLNSNEKINQTEISNFLEKNFEVVVIISIFVFILFVFFLVLGIASRGGLIFAIEKIDSKKKISFKTSFKEGKRNFGKILGLNLLIFFSLFLIFLVISVPVIYCFATQKIITGIIISIPAFLLAIISIVLANYLKIFGQIYIVSSELKIISSLENAYKLFISNLWSSFIMGLILIPISMIFGILILGLFIVLALIFLPFGVLAWFLLKDTGIIITAIFAFPIVLFLAILFSSIFQTFRQAVWFLFFKEIAREEDTEKVLEKMNQEKKIVVPEAKPTRGIIQSEID